MKVGQPDRSRSSKSLSGEALQRQHRSLKVGSSFNGLGPSPLERMIGVQIPASQPSLVCWGMAEWPIALAFGARCRGFESHSPCQVQFFELLLYNCIMYEVQKIEAIRLRNEERKSLKEIARLLGRNKSTVHYWLKGKDAKPLSKEELRVRQEKRSRTYSENARKRREANQSRFYTASVTSMTRQQKGQIAESAILFRLALHGFSVLRHVFDGCSSDWVVLSQSGVARHIQVKWMGRGKVGSPLMRLTTTVTGNKKRRYSKGEVDFFVGYDLYTDTAYIFAADRVGAKVTKTATAAAAERWDLLRG